MFDETPNPGFTNWVISEIKSVSSFVCVIELRISQASRDSLIVGIEKNNDQLLLLLHKFTIEIIIITVCS
jgi:hypothetical protein